MRTAVSHICESRQSLGHNIQSCFDLKWDTVMYQLRWFHLPGDPSVKLLIAAISSQVTHVLVLLGHRGKTLFCWPTFTPDSKWKQIQRKGSEVILFPGTEKKNAAKLMLRKHSWSCFYQMTIIQSNININSKTWGRGAHPNNWVRDRHTDRHTHTCKRVSEHCSRGDTGAVLWDQLHQRKVTVGAIKHMS